MRRTPVSLLESLQRENSREAWNRFVQLYTPLFAHWGRRTGMPADQVEDFCQEVFAVLVVELPKFVYDPGKSFHGWLKTLVMNVWRARARRKEPPTVNEENLANHPSSQDDPAVWLEHDEFRRLLLARGLQIVKADFDERTQRAFEKILEGRQSMREIADELGLTPGAVSAAKLRIMHRLRSELRGMLD